MHAMHAIHCRLYPVALLSDYKFALLSYCYPIYADDLQHVLVDK